MSINDMRGDIRPKKKLLREVLPNTRKRSVERVPSVKSTTQDSVVRPRKETSFFRQPFIIIVLAAFIFLVVTVLDSLAKATITITPESEVLALDATQFSAVSTVREDAVLSRIMKIEGSAEVRLKTTGVETVNERARGTVVVFNEYSTAPQRLLIETRLESPEGNIYKTTKPVTIPGYTKKGNEIIPGSIEVSVFADETGEAYNEGLTDFTLVGFKGRPQYEKIYARSKTPLEGGFSGTRGIVSSEDRESAQKSLERELEETLFADATLEIPDTFIAYNTATFLSSSVTERPADGYSILVMEGTLSLLLLEKESLNTAIAQTSAIDYEGIALSIPDLDSLSFSFVTDPTEPLTDSSPTLFTLSGSADIVRVVDEEVLLEELQGVKKKDLVSVFSTHESILSTHTVIRPFWKSALPEKTEAIRIRYVDTEEAL